MAYTIEDRDKLQAAIVSGVRRVRFNDREVEYQTLEDMRDLLAEMNSQLSPSNTARNYRVAAFDKGV